MRRVPFVLACCILLLPQLVAQQAGDEAQERKRDPRDLPAESDLVETVSVELAEVRILVTDRRGNAVNDLRPEEIKIFENGKRQELAYLDQVSGTRYAGREDDTPPPAAVYTLEGEMVDAEPVDLVMPAKSQRRVVLAFDVRNSKLNIRDEWQAAAEEWLRSEMRDDDLVSIVVFRSYPDWLVTFTSDRQRLLQALASVSLEAAFQDRDKRRDVDSLVDDIHTLCSDLGRAGDRRRGDRGKIGRGQDQFDEQSCAFNLAEGQVQQWDVETRETLDTLRALTGQLASIPGRKMVILFSEGWVTDPATAGAQAMMAVFGVGVVDMSSVVWTFDRNASTELNQLHQVAKAADVSFFTIDTTRGYDSGFGGQLQRGQSMAQQRAGVNPWSEMNWETRQTLNSLAKETGGRSYYGTKKLEEKITAAANSYFGYYLVGYYRSEPTARAGKVRVEIDRAKLDIGYPDKPTLWPHRPNPVRLDLSVGRPQVVPGMGDQVVPFKLTMNLSDIPLRRGGGERGAQLGIYIQAVRLDGTVAAEQLDVETVALDRSAAKQRAGLAYEHLTDLTLPDGPYRIRARVSDDRQEIVAERVIDLTVDSGTVIGGFPAAATEAD